MKKYLSIYRNWRVNALAMLALAAFILLAGETDDTATFIAIKAAGFALCYAIYILGKYWNKRGLIDELMSIADEEE